MGALVRALPGVHEQRPTDLNTIVTQPEVYVTFTPVREAVRSGIFAVAGHAPVPERSRRFPLFRASAGGLPGAGEGAWWLWDGKKEWKIGTLSAAQRELPEHAALMPPVIIARFEADWLPGQPEPPARDLPGADEDPIPDGFLRHYLYFDDQEKARAAAERARAIGARVLVEVSLHDDRWLVRADLRATSDERRDELERLATEFQGEYDGWEGET